MESRDRPSLLTPSTKSNMNSQPRVTENLRSVSEALLSPLHDKRVQVITNYLSSRKPIECLLLVGSFSHSIVWTSGSNMEKALQDTTKGCWWCQSWGYVKTYCMRRILSWRVKPKHDAHEIETRDKRNAWNQKRGRLGATALVLNHLGCTIVQGDFAFLTFASFGTIHARIYSILLHSTPLYSYPNYLKAEGRSSRSWSFCQSSALSALWSSISKPTEHPKLSSFSGGSAQPGQTSSWRGDRSIAGSDE